MKVLIVIAGLAIAQLFYPVYGSEDVGTIQPIYVPPPTLTDSRGNVIEDVLSGHQVVIFYSYNNTNDQMQPFVMLFEVRDEQGVSQHIAWQTGIAQPDSTANIGVFWMPEYSGDHEIRIFIVSDLQNPRVLSPVASHMVFVG